METSRTILIVDDVDVNREMMKSLFSAPEEYTVLSASNGLEAMEVVKKHVKSISMILLDIIMPKMNGIEFLKWLSSSEYQYIPVIAVTSDERYQLEALQNGAWDFITKPADEQVIKTRIHNVLARYVLADERKKNEITTRAKLEMDNLVNSIPGGISICEITSAINLLYFSDGVARLSGYEPGEYKEVIQGDATKIIYREDRERIIKAIQLAMDNNTSLDETYRIYHKNGGIVWVHLTGVLIDKEPDAFIMQAVIQKSSRMAQLYDNIVNESQNLIYVNDVVNYDLLYINKTGLKEIGKETSDYTKKKCYEFLFNREKPCTFCRIHQMSANDYLTRDFCYSKNGRTYAMRGKLTNWNGLAAHVEYLQDVSEIRKTEMYNKELSQQLESMIENIPGGMCVYRQDETGYHLLVHNQAFFNVLGYSKEHQEAILKKNSFLNVHPDDLQELKDVFDEGIKKQSNINHTYRIFNDLKHCYIWVNLSAVVVEQSDHSKILYASYTDVTKERQTQEKLIQTQNTLKELQQQAEDALENYQSLVNAVPGGIAQYEIKKGEILTRYFSDGVCELTGYSRAERSAIPTKDVLSAAYKDDIPSVTKAISDAVRKREDLNVTYRINTKENIPRWVHLSAAYSLGKNGECLYQAVYTDVDKLKRIEQALQENQLRYEVAIKSSGINIWEYDIQKDSLYVVSNSSRIKQNCFQIDNYIQSTLSNGYVREDSIERFLNMFEQLRKGVRELSEDIWYKTTDEAGWWCERITYTTTFDRSGTPTKAYGAGRDVTREKEAEKKFHEEVSYRKAMQSSNLDSIMMDLTSNVLVEINSIFKEVLSLNKSSADHYFKVTSQSIVGKQNIDNYNKVFNRKALLDIFKRGEFTITSNITKLYEGKIYWVEYNVYLIQNPDTKHIIAHISSVDVTQEKVMETIMETVAKSDYDFFMVVDGTSDSAQDFGVKDNHHIFKESESYEENIIKQIYLEVTFEDIDRVINECKIENVWRHIKNGETYKFNYSINLPNGQIRRKQIQMVAISSERKTFLLSRIDVNNIYEEQQAAKHQLQTALKEAEKANRTKNDFLSRMSHDVRTPMNAVISLSELAQESDNLAEIKNYLQKIDNSSKYLLAIINDVLNLSKMENVGLKLRPTIVSTDQFIKETLAIVMPVIEKKQINLQIKKTGDYIKYMRFDAVYVKQVIVNLLSNALKFTTDGGNVELSIENELCKEGFVKNRIVIKDDGVGIDPAFLPRVFIPFEQEESQNDLNRQGTGLGLSIVKGIVEQMGGKIWVESEKGKGSAFYIEWELETVSKKEVKQNSAQTLIDKVDPLKGKRILVVEDHPLNIEIAKKLLEKKGMIVDYCTNGQSALTCFETSKQGYYDAILMDIRMPIMNGLEATIKIRALQREEAKQIPIIAMSANAFEEDIQKSLDAGMNAHLVKPINPQTLYDTLSQYTKDREEI